MMLFLPVIWSFLFIDNRRNVYLDLKTEKNIDMFNKSH